MDGSETVRRRTVLRTIGIAVAAGAGVLGALTGDVAAWDRQDVEFKGCSEVWIVVGSDDVLYDPPTVARVVLALPDGGTTCRDVEFTPSNTTRIPGQYGDAPVRKVRAGTGEKVLGVIIYNYRKVDRFSSPSCIYTNHNTCATTPGTPSIEEAACVEDARNNDGYDCGITMTPEPGTSPPGSERDDRPVKQPSRNDTDDQSESEPGRRGPPGRP
ncbi:MAG: hypothetical protein ABEI98_12665 [Halorhabdus sp.]